MALEDSTTSTSVCFAEKPGIEDLAPVTSVQLDRMLLHRMDATPQQVQRTPRLIRRDCLEHFVLHLSSQDGSAEVSDGSVALKAGVVSINDLARPSLRAAQPEQGSIILSVSRGLVAEALGSTDGLHGLVLDSETGLLLAIHMRALAARADRISTDAAADIARATAHLLAASVAERTGLARRVDGDGVGLLRAKRFIEGNLGAPGLSPEQIAAAAAVSRSSLFRMFKPLGGVVSYVQRRRLDRVRACLIGPAEAPSCDSGLSSRLHQPFPFQSSISQPLRLYPGRHAREQIAARAGAAFRGAERRLRRLGARPRVGSRSARPRTSANPAAWATGIKSHQAASPRSERTNVELTASIDSLEPARS